eukprot:CAMPEP_0172312502 /NCGR_PEP_ID=MMETSP1058-20130122/17715_1 /TAXON_ID=83371 /ORGANISM="Detonula confervacea, Strain CCMP 353" /LENGTH=439 /DNA_ID=CAMNT_0013025981 /DNA_START=29 /DNA_END=1348 /DNA_ORIENTATION=+
MGKRSKQGASLRAKKRAKIADQQLVQALTEQGEQTRVQSKEDDELFVLDTVRKETAATIKAAAARRNSALEKKKEAESKKKQKYEYSEREKRQIQKVLKNHGKEEIIARAEKGKARLDQKKIRKQISAAATKPTFDLWDAPTVDKKRKSNVAKPPVVDDPIFDPPTQSTGKLSKKQLKDRKRVQANAPPQLAVEVAHPGQSYHPDKEHHQDAIGEALSIEIRRNEAVEYKAKPISDGMSAYTKGFILDSDAEEEDSSDEEEDDNNTAAAKVIKRKEKLTRAQRNKQKRVKAEQTALKERKTRKQFMHQVTESHIHNKAVKRSEREHAERQAELEKMRAEKKAQPLGKNLWNKMSQKDPIRTPSLPVALTEELKSKDGSNEGGGGGLRTVTPKGSLVTDRLESMVARNMISKKRVGGRRIVQGKKRPKRRGAQGTEYLLV